MTAALKRGESKMARFQQSPAAYSFTATSVLLTTSPRHPVD